MKLTAVFWTKSCAAYSLIFWAPLVISDLLGPNNTNPNVPILLTAVPYAFAAVFTYTIGWSSQTRGERRLHTAVPFSIGGLVLLAAPLLPMGTVAGGVMGFVGLCVALSVSNGTGPLTALVMAVLPPEAQSAGLALWNSGANLGGYAGPALFGWLKHHTGTHAAGMAVCTLQND
jgi:MFS transporter, ACS family, tartrate transporter